MPNKTRNEIFVDSKTKNYRKRVSALRTGICNMNK